NGSVPKAVDGCTSQRIASDCCAHTDGGHKEVWWQVDLRQQSVIERVKIIYRNEDLTLTRLGGFEIYLSDTSDWRSGERCYKDNTASLELMSATQDVACVGVGQYVTLYNNRTVKTRSWYYHDAVFELCEVYVFGCPYGKFGNGHCNDDCLNCNICLPTSGECYCYDGYYGPTCTPCPTGCSTNTCDQTSGNCNQCDVGFYSYHCDQNCPSNCKNNVCNKVNGQCAECDFGFFGNHCDQQCPGNCENSTCNKDSGLCTECITGFYGNVCDQACPDNCGNNICSILDGQCLIPLSEKQTGNNICSNIGWYTGYAVLGAFLGISVCFNICLIVLFLRHARKTKSPNDPPETFGIQQSRGSSENRSYEGLDMMKVGNVQNVYDGIQD
ncbi:cell death abnormality protein 1-like, partial [Argopecten irradians]|uniref:cell death abnormality protein 1-like n=1 Tax=Argopecten irradians TaxID=31199 RepID=UPI0037188A4A